MCTPWTQSLLEAFRSEGLGFALLEGTRRGTSDSILLLAALEDDADPIVRLAALARKCEMDDDDASLAPGARRRALALLEEEHPLLRYLGLLTLACEEQPQIPEAILPR